MAKNPLAHMPVKVGAKKGGCYAGGLVPAPNSVGTLGVDGYNKMLANMKAGTFGNQPAAAPNALTAGIAQPAAPVAAAAAAAPVAAPVTPTPAAPAAPAKPAGLSISNGMDSGGGLQITNGFDSTPAPLANTQPAQTTTRLSSAQGYARGKVPSMTDGIIRGPGGPTDDKVDAKVSPKEAILPARTVQAIGGPAAVKALIERTNGGMPPESEVVDSGKYAVGYNGMPEEDPYTKRTGQPNMYAEDNQAIRDFADKNILPATRQAIGAANADVSQAQAEGRGAYATGRALRGMGEAAAAVPADVYDVGRKGVNAIGDLAGSAVDAVKPTAQGFWSGLTGAQPKQQAPAARPAATPLVAAAAAPAGPNYGNEPNAPANTPAPLSAAARPAPAQAIARLPSPGADTQVGSYGAPAQIQQPSGYQPAPEQTKPERLATNGTSWEEGENARRRSFDNFVTRSDLQSGMRDAQRSGRRGEAAAAANALTSFNNQADAHEEKAGEFDRGMKALDAKTAKDQEMEGVKSKNVLAQLSTQGQNALATTGMQGQNALAAEALRGRSMRDVAALNADAAKANREYVNPLDADLKRQQLQDAQIRSGLRDRLISASPEQQQAIARQIAGLDGKYQDRDGSEMVKARMGLVEGLAKAYNGSNGVPMGPDNKPISFEQFAAPALAAATGQQKAAPATPTFEQYAEQIRARNKGQQLNDKQLQDAYSQRYGQ